MKPKEFLLLVLVLAATLALVVGSMYDMGLSSTSKDIQSYINTVNND